MNKEFTQAKTLSGEVSLPGDHMIAVLASVIASFAQGQTILSNFPKHKECLWMLELLSQLGIAVDHSPGDEQVTVHGKGKKGWSQPENALDIGNSDVLVKLLSGGLAGQDFEAHIQGDSFFSMVPMDEIIGPLRQMDANLYAEQDSHLPFRFCGAVLQGKIHVLDIMDANTKSCLLLAGLNARGKTCITETYASRDHTERLLAGFGAPVRFQHQDDKPKNEDELSRRIRLAQSRRQTKTSDAKVVPYLIEVEGVGNLQSCRFTIPGDITMASSLLVLGSLLQKSELVLKNVSLNTSRNGAMQLLRRMGADIEVFGKRDDCGETHGDIRVKSAKLAGRKFSSEDMINMIDEVPAIAVAAAFAKGETVIRNIERLRNIDADCISALTHNLRCMGVKVGELPDGLVIEGARDYDGATFRSFDDSRIALAFSVASLRCRGKSMLESTDVLEQEFPMFLPMLEKITGAE